MANESHDSVHKQRLSQLIAEVDGPPKSTMKTENAEREATRLLAGFLRWSAFGLVCLAAGFWTGSYNASLRFSLEKPSEIQDLNSQGWKSEGTGVFYRWCQHHCQSPTLYGGGVIQVFEVKCVNRHCGDLVMSFNVLNSKGEVVDKLMMHEKGLQGETRRFFVESQSVEAVSLELSAFSARARI